MEWQVTGSAVLPVNISAASHNPVRLPRCNCYGSFKGHGAGATSRRASHVPRRPLRWTIQASTSNGTEEAVRDLNANGAPREGASTDLSIIWARLVKVSPQLPSKPECSMRLQMRSSRCASLQLGVPYWQDPVEGKKARWGLAGVVALTLGQTGVR